MKLHIDELAVKRVLVFIALGSLAMLTYNLLEPTSTTVPTDNTQNAQSIQ